ncbi:hypothetical protein P029_00525 [Anaplasma phagocytophilum str. Norway variant2]|uniref:Uncharacterized protein n=1 Tax=Anaplasma phagocytophilum str. Norway variant2 TaxID=1392507 RepID=A0A168H328_ANAPH|nr:hypothetical protein P029_00525 [Anaplasma phagocytophilum str. Norway variant2]
MQFANTVKISHPKIDEKVCNKSYAKGAGDSSSTTYGTGLTSNTNTAQCSGLNTPGTNKISTFVEGVKLQDGTYWPTGSYSSSSQAKLKEQNSNANAVAKDLVALNRDEKTIVAGLLAKTIEGGEVVEIRAVSSTFIRI